MPYPTLPLPNTWAATVHGGAGAAVELAVLAGGCQAAFGFHFYRAPQPLRVRPSHGPRYGTFALTVELEGGLHTLSLQQVSAWGVWVRWWGWAPALALADDMRGGRGWWSAERLYYGSCLEPITTC